MQSFLIIFCQIGALAATKHTARDHCPLISLKASLLAIFQNSQQTSKELSLALLFSSSKHLSKLMAIIIFHL